MNEAFRSIQRSLPVGVFALLSFALAFAVPEQSRTGDDGRAADPRLREVLEAFDRVQSGIRTLSAEFSETTTSQILSEPLQSRGRFFLTKPASVLWEYVEPEPMRFVVANDEYIGYFPERKKAERSDVRRWSERIFRIFGLGQTSEELAKFYTIRLADPDPDMKGTKLLVLEPKKRRVRRRVEQVRFWVDASTYLPVRFELTGREGYARVIRFRDVRVNPDLSATLYRLEVPPGVKVTSGTSGLDAVRPRGPSQAPRP